MYLGLTGDEKRLLEEFNGISGTQPGEVADPGPTTLDSEVWEDLEQEGLDRGFIDDIQGLLEGKLV